MGTMGRLIAKIGKAKQASDYIEAHFVRSLELDPPLSLLTMVELVVPRGENHQVKLSSLELVKATPRELEMLLSYLIVSQKICPYFSCI